MEKKIIITIARDFGSGGKAIGVELGRRLGIPCYEDEILDMASEASGLNKALFYEVNEKLRGTIIKKLKGVPYKYEIHPSSEQFESDDSLFNIQAGIIRELALTKSCIIVGKCADVVLGDLKYVYRFFIDAPNNVCAYSVAEKMNISVSEAERLVVKTNKYRADYYKYYTGKDWKNPDNYDFMLNSARIGRERCVDFIEEYIKKSAC